MAFLFVALQFWRKCCRWLTEGIGNFRFVIIRAYKRQISAHFLLEYTKRGDDF